MKAPAPFITLDNITLRLRDQWFLENTSWQINSDEHWVVLGPNGSGKSTLVKAILGDIPVVKGKIIHHFAPDSILRRLSGRIAYVSYEQYRDIIEQEDLEEAFREFSGNINEVTTVKELLVKNLPDHQDAARDLNKCLSRIPDQLDIEPLLDRSVRSLSTGEVSRMLLARALINQPDLLILDEPLDGLDISSRNFLLEMIGTLMAGDLRVILITHRLEEIPPAITHVLFLKDGEVLLKGRKEKLFNHDTIQKVYSPETSQLNHDEFKAFVRRVFPPAARDPGGRHTGAGRNRVLIKMRNVKVKYGDRAALDNFDWTVRDGENWAILGPNGAGKTTVLKLALGDNLQSYANEIALFGKRMGAGQSIWDIKKHIGVISSDLQARYRKKITASDVVCSGFFDSFGLYRHCTDEQLELADRWIKILQIEKIAGRRFDLLSYGQRQLVLIARAMVKSPLMLFLDEPCESLDMTNRKKLLETAEYIGSETGTNLVYVTHYEDEILPCITDIVLLDAGKTVGFKK
ncbi:MAG: ATP-binding cassette domain-containing protein [Pseudomonadota bacterium]